MDHEIEACGLRLLEGLAQPTKRARLAEKLEGMSESAIEEQLEVLRARGLVFEEDDRCMSLIVDSGRDQGSL